MGQGNGAPGGPARAGLTFRRGLHSVFRVIAVSAGPPRTYARLSHPGLRKIGGVWFLGFIPFLFLGGEVVVRAGAGLVG